MKQCSGPCGLPKPYADFSKNRQNSDGYAIYCRVCNRAKIKQWRKANPEKTLQIQANYRKKRRRKQDLTPFPISASTHAKPSAT